MVVFEGNFGKKGCGWRWGNLQWSGQTVEPLYWGLRDITHSIV